MTVNGATTLIFRNDAYMAGRQIGPFLIERQLGVGGMGVVYLATHEPTGKLVALKVLSPALSSDEKLIRRFEREIDILKRMSHPNIVKYYGGGTHEQQRYYAMEFIDGGSLQDILKKRQRLDWERTVQVGRQLCAALEHAHNAGIIHRDLKPGNLFISRKGRLKLGDFGIARDTEATALTAAGKTVGTYAYMAPEQIHGNAPISRKTDLYAAGCLLFETMTGETPFQADNPAEMLMQHLNDDPRNIRDIVPECPIWLDELVERMLAKNPDDRPHDALAVHTELSEILQKMTESDAATAFGATSSTVPVAGEPAPRKKKKRKRDQGQIYEQTWFLAGCLIALIGGAVWLAMPPGQNSLYLDARKAWESGDETTLREGRDRYMLPYLERFPDGQFAKEIGQWADEIQVNVLEAQAEKKARGNKEARDEYEAAYIKAFLAEQDRDRNPLEAIELYHDMISRMNAVEAAKHWRMLAERRLAAAKATLLASPECDDRIRSRMEDAEAHFMARRFADAQRIWVNFREVFYGERGVENFYLYAKHRANEEPAEIPVGGAEK